MTDNEIKKALECCGRESCNGCPYREGKCHQGNPMIRDALDLINRQQAEVERLKKALNTDFVFRGSRANGKTQYISELIKVRVETIEAKAIKEFAERLKGRSRPTLEYCEVVLASEIDKLLAEMLGDADV